MKNKKNREFYSKGKLNFLTFANDKYISQANAIEFSRRFDYLDEIEVWEFGCGTGHFALNFLDHLKKTNREIYKKTNYTVFDFSKKMLSNAKKLLAKHRIETVVYEGPDEIPKDKVHYVRMNEFWDDLEADIFTFKQNKVYNILKKKYQNNPAAYEFLKMLPSESEVVINSQAAHHLWQINTKLVYGGLIDVFDYGFTTIECPFDTNLGFIRRENEHITYDINFIYMKAFARSLNLNTYIELQENYVNSIFSDLREVEMEGRLCYMSPDELKKNSKKLKLRGYSDAFILGDTIEASEYHHMRIWK
ncbi:SAM-dependent methyltransferase [Candidatus Micrarchaeota archaeon]|nr:SAM-dependent methyltransferase [Candidatus Micrarchaeota archaeon]